MLHGVWTKTESGAASIGYNLKMQVCQSLPAPLCRVQLVHPRVPVSVASQPSFHMEKSSSWGEPLQPPDIIIPWTLKSGRGVFPSHSSLSVLPLVVLPFHPTPSPTVAVLQVPSLPFPVHSAHLSLSLPLRFSLFPPFIPQFLSLYFNPNFSFCPQSKFEFI